MADLMAEACSGTGHHVKHAQNKILLNKTGNVLKRSGQCPAVRANEATRAWYQPLWDNEP